MRYLALLLLAPWLLILGWAYARFPRDLPRVPARRAFDAVVLMLAVVLTTLAVWASFDAVSVPEAAGLGRRSGAIWQQVLPALCGYGAWALVLFCALMIRARVWSRHAGAPHG